MVMWSGPCRIDIPVGTEFFDMLSDYDYKQKTSVENYVFSGGLVGSWTQHPLTKPMFSSLYRTHDKISICNSNLLVFKKFQEYCNVKKLHVSSTCFSNFFNENQSVYDTVIIHWDSIARVHQFTITLTFPTGLESGMIIVYLSTPHVRVFFKVMVFIPAV
jgi:hypothetical protein